MENNRVENEAPQELTDEQQKALAAAISNVALNRQIWIETSMMLLIANLHKMGQPFDPKKCQWSHAPLYVRYDGKTVAKHNLLLQNEKKVILEG